MFTFQKRCKLFVYEQNVAMQAHVDIRLAVSYKLFFLFFPCLVEFDGSQVNSVETLSST